MRHPNTICHMDAMEYADAFQRGVKMTETQLSEAMQSLSERLAKLEATGEVQSYMLAAYRGYETAQNWTRHRWLPEVVTLNESQEAS